MDDTPSFDRVAKLVRATQLRESKEVTGVEAIDAVRPLRPDVVVMDFNMPHMNGLEGICTGRGCCSASEAASCLCVHVTIY